MCLLMKSRDEYYRTELRMELERRMAKNPQYSLRAFSRAISLDPSYVSKILNGQRSVTERVIKKISEHLGVLPLEHLSSQKSDNKYEENYKYIEEHEQKMILSHWVHFALLELLVNPKVNQDPSELAKRLGLDLYTVTSAIERLKRLSFIEKKRSRYTVLKQSTHWVNPQKTTEVRRSFQRKIMEAAIDKIDSVDFSKRDNSSVIMSFDTRLMPVVREKITHFRRELNSFIESESRDKKEVYSLAVAFFPLTDDHKK